MADDKSSLRTASFSCYLDKAKDNRLQRISAPEIPINVLSSAKPRKPSLTRNISNSNINKNSSNHADLRVDSFSYRNNVDSAPIHDGEIGVFGAADNCLSMKHAADLAGAGSNSRRRTASLRSEASSSCNSQTALMSILNRNGSQASKQKKAINGRRMFLGFSCNGGCFDKKDVHINHHLPTRARSQRIDHLAVPDSVKQQQGEEEGIEINLEESRKSIEVFGSGATFKGEVAKNMERKLSMLTWDAIPKAQNIPTSRDGDDVASDASSDLFEIENISGAAHPVIADDDTSLCTSPASRYAPSEASIQWSDATAATATAAASNVRVTGDVTPRSNAAHKGRHYGCRSQKEVEVVASKNKDEAALN